MKRTGQSNIAVVGWGRGMGHEGHMYLADAVITQAQQMHADPYFFVSKTVGKDDPLFPEEKIKIYQRVFPQQATIFSAEGNLNEALTQLANLGYKGVVVVVGADQKNAFKYLERPNKEGVPVFQSMGLDKLKVISRQETRSKFASAEGPRATPMREILLQPDATEEQKYEVWRRDLPKALSDKEVMDLMRKAEARLLGAVKTKAIKEYIERIKPLLSEATGAQKEKLAKLLSEANRQLMENRIMDRNAKINAYYVSKKGDRHKVAENIPYYLLDKLVPLLTKKYAITMNDIEVRPADQSQYRRSSQPELAEGMQCTTNEVAELLYNTKPELFTKFGDEFVMNAIEQACEQHQGSAQEVAGKAVEILKQGITEGIFDRFKKKPPQPQVADPGNYPRIGSDIAQWMRDAVEYHKATLPDSLWKLFCPSYPDYLPTRVRVGTSEKTIRAHLGDYVQLRDANPEAKKLARQKFEPNHIYPNGPREDYQNNLNEFAPDGFNGGDDGEEFNPRLAKMAQDEGFVKGVSLADAATLEMALKINQWDTHDSGIYKQYFAKGFKEGRMNKINHDNKQYNLNLKLMKDGSIKQKQVDEAYDHNAPFNAADFNRHMEQLRAREELRKTDPVKALVGDLIDKDNAARNVKKKPQDDDSIGINDPRHPGWGALHNTLEESPEEALKYATKAHAGQTRSGGDPYISHPVRVANHIKQFKQSHNLDALISAAYLHDTIEDTDTTQEILHDLFGGLVASLVQELTSDPAQIKKMGKAQYLAHKMAAMSSYALVIKLADRLDNVKDITTAKTPEWRAKYAKETNHILDYIEKTRALSGTHQKLIELIRAKLAEIDNPPQQGVAEAGFTKTPSGDYINQHTGVRSSTAPKQKPVRGYKWEVNFDYGPHQTTSVKVTASSENEACSKAEKLAEKNGYRSIMINWAKPAEQGVAEAEGISRRGILKGIAGAAAAGAAGKASAIAGAFPTPSHQAAMYKAAADSNAAQARADAAEKAKREAQRLKQGTADIERLNKINYHGGKVTPINATWDGDSDFMDVDGTKYSMASRMPIRGDEPGNMKLVSTREGRQVYMWTRNSLKGVVGRYFYPAPAGSSQINEFAPGNGDDDGLPNAEYEVYQCSLDDQFEWIGEPLMQTDRLDKAHGFAYKLWQKHPDKCFMVWQERSQGSRGGYGPVGSVLAPSEDDITESSDYLDEK